MAKKKELQEALLKGDLPIGGIELNCAVLKDGTRILTATSIFQAFSRSRKGMNSRLEINGTKMPPFLAAKNLKPLITNELVRRTESIEYLDGKSVKRGYEASILPEMCELYLKARREGVLTAPQEKLAIQSEILLSSFAKIGITALIDEATGYQHDRQYDALRILLQQYIKEGMQKWVKRFPDRFFEELDKLYKNPKTKATKRPQYYGKFINKYVYEPLENGYVKQELDKKNITDDGKRKAHFHQWLTDFGVNQLTIQLGRVLGVMEISPNLRRFKDTISRQKQLSIQPELFDDPYDED